jgi:hypothetical protein
MQRLPCACCNELRSLGNLITVEPTGDWLLRLTNRLNWCHTKYEVNAFTKSFYSVTVDVLEIVPEFKEVPLAPNGVKLIDLTEKECCVQVIT